jgi:hypothetical protein
MLGGPATRGSSRIKFSRPHKCGNPKIPNIFHGCPKIMKLGVWPPLTMPKIAAKNRAKIRSLGPRKGCCRFVKKYVRWRQTRRGSYCYYRGHPSPPNGPHAQGSLCPFDEYCVGCWGPTTMSTRLHHHGGRRRWWGGGRPSRGRPPATFPANSPVDPKMCGISNGTYGATCLLPY